MATLIQQKTLLGHYSMLYERHGRRWTLKQHCGLTWINETYYQISIHSGRFIAHYKNL